MNVSLATRVRALAMPFLAMFWCAVGTVALGAQSEAAAAAKPREVKGLVVDEAGKPIEGVAIGWYESWAQTLPSEAVAQPVATTDANGAFAFAFTADAHADGDAAQLWFVAPGRVHVACYAYEADRQPIVLGKARACAGRVVDADGKPLGAVLVRAFDALATSTWLQANSACMVCTAARTDAQGRFVLSAGCAEGMLIGVELPNGVAECGPTVAGEPIELRVRSLPTLAIAVRDAGDRPVAGALVRAYGSGALSARFGGARRAGADGLVRVPNDGIHYVGVKAKVDGALATNDQQCEPGATTLRLVVRSAVATDAGAPTLDVRVTDAQGQPVREFRAALFATNVEQVSYSTDAPLLREFARASRAAVDGVAKVPWQPSDARDTAYAVVVAAGCALARVPVATGQPIEVKLEPAVPITGVVIDKKTNAPLAGARVWSLPAGQADADWLLSQYGGVDGLDPHEGVVVTGADGAFTLTQAGVGVHHVFCRLPGGGWCKPLPVTLTGEGAPKKLRFVVPPLQTFTVRTGLAPPPLGARLQLRRKSEQRFGDVENWPLGADVALAADGSAELAGVQPDNYAALLVVPRRFRQGGVEPIQLGVLKVGVDQAAVEFVGKKSLPAIVRGRITGPVPGGRLVVVSIAKHEGNSWYGQLHCTGPFALVGLGGTYELQEPPGERALLVLDLVTGVLLHRGELVKVAPASERTVDLAVRARQVELQFRAKDRTAVPLLQLELRPEATFWPTGLGMMSDLDNDTYSCGMGIVVPADLQPVRVWLPECDVRARLWGGGAQSGPVLRQEHAIDLAGKPAKPLVLDLDEAK